MTNIYVNLRLGRDWQRLVTSRNYIGYNWQGMHNKGCCFVVALPEVFPAGKRITLEHTLRHHFRTQPFCITLEHKIKHHFRTQPYTHTSDLLTGARLWKKNAFQSETNTKKLLVWEFDSFQPCHKVPRLPRKRTVDVQKCHTCHAKWRSMSKGPTPATENEGEYMKQKPCCTWCKKSNETFRIYMLLHLM